jgi:hypothetical protein
MINPTIHDALRALGCKGGWKIKNGEISGWTCKTPQPSNEAIQEKLIELQADYDSKQYQRDRETSYPEIREQLDLLYHDMTAGKGDKTGEWYKAVNKVKTDNPKP